MVTEVSLIEIAKTTRQAAQKSAVLSTEAKNQAIEAVAQALEKAKPKIITANQLDCRIAETDGIAKPLYNRLKMDEAKLNSAIAGLRNVATLRDPIGVVQIHRELDAGLILKRITCPLGVIGVVFEARPDAVIQISALAIKSGNG
ncbi:MAG: gamma-glutamyl-phosphate reductase, partial [Trichodesmium sp. St5_bin8]|nr:gamma-glutamyl-phosphate reductase [Trichodesmium sp. St5_bin8]